MAKFNRVNTNNTEVRCHFLLGHLDSLVIVHDIYTRLCRGNNMV